MLLQEQNVQATAKGAIPDHSVVNALNALNSLKNIGLEEAKSEEEDIQMQNSPKIQLLEQKRLLVGISNIIDNTDSDKHDENHLSNNSNNLDENEDDDSEGEVPDTQREAYKAGEPSGNGFS